VKSGFRDRQRRQEGPWSCLPGCPTRPTLICAGVQSDNGLRTPVVKEVFKTLDPGSERGTKEQPTCAEEKRKYVLRGWTPKGGHLRTGHST